MQKNLFLEAVNQYNFYTENGAVSHATTGDALVDYFAKAGTYRDRKLKDVYANISLAWNESPLLTLQMLLYLRMITRNTDGFFDSETVQKGQGNRDEFRKAIGWVAKYEPKAFYNNMWLIPVVGTWKDLWHEDLINILDRKNVYALIKKGMEDDFNAPLIAKYLPKIRAKAQRFNDRHRILNNFAFGLCEYLGWTAKDYRLFKASGEAHSFQRKMSAGLWDELDFARISGKALFQLVNKKGKDGKTTLERHHLEARFLEWIKDQPTAKFTGFVYELFKSVSTGMSLAQRYTVNKQFDGLLELARKDNGGISGNVWCALDTSGSMVTKVVKDITAYDICVSLGIYFASLNEGAFQNHVIMFDNVSRVLKIGGGFCDKALQIKSATTAWGSTNFQSVIDEIVRIRTDRPEVPISDFPDTLIVVSDMQFNPTDNNTTNYKEAMDKLAKVGLPKMKIIWWWVTGRAADFPSTIQDEGVTMIGGFDGSVVTLILGGKQTTVDTTTGEVRQLNAYENMLKALDQELLRQVKIN